jgi:putative flippase GtrA
MGMDRPASAWQNCRMAESIGMTEVRMSAAQLFRYGLVGIASNLTGYLIFLLITTMGIGPKTAMTMLYAVGATIGFIGNRTWTFAHHGTFLRSGVRYVIAHCCGYLINLAVLLTFVDVLGYSHRWVQAIAIFVVAGFLFVTFKYFVFPPASTVTGSGG